MSKKREDESIQFFDSSDFIKYFQDLRNSRSTIRKLFDSIYYPVMRVAENLKPIMIYRHIIWACQRLFRGFDDTICWNLDYRISEFILPRLKHFRKNNRIGVPCTIFNESNGDDSTEELHQKKIEEWNIILDKMILAFENIVKDDYDKDSYKKQQEEIEEGLKLFCTHFRGLWD